MSGDTGLVPGLTRVCLFQIPRYIITLHELLAHTPHDHVERESLEYAKSKLEEPVSYTHLTLPTSSTV